MRQAIIWINDGEFTDTYISLNKLKYTLATHNL